MSNFIITADTTMDLPREMIQQYDIRPIPSYVSLGEDNMDDYPDITAQDLFEYVAKTGNLPKTAAANPGDYEHFFAKIRETDDRPIIHIAKSSGISSCYENAVIASRSFEQIYPVDSLGLGSGSGLVVLKAARSELSDPEALVAELDEYKTRIECSFVIETLDFLYKGGRCSGLAALGANLLKLRPEIVVDKGYMHAGKKYRGKYEKVLLDFTEEKFRQPEQFEDDLLFVNHTLQDPALLQTLLNYIKGLHYFKEIIEVPACAAIATHCGPNTFGFHPVRKKA